MGHKLLKLNDFWHNRYLGTIFAPDKDMGRKSLVKGGAIHVYGCACGGTFGRGLLFGLGRILLNRRSAGERFT